MALKDKFQKRLDGMKVEGDWRMKLAVYGGAVLMVGTILLVLYLLLGRVGSGPPEVGAVTLKSDGLTATPLQNQIYTTQDGKREDMRRLVPSEVGEEAPTVVFDHSTTVLFEGDSENGDFAFTIYDEQGRIYKERSDMFQCPQEPGKYLVCEETYWGTAKENIGMEYYFWIEVTEEYLTSHEGEGE